MLAGKWKLLHGAPLILVLLLAGCNPITRHKVLSTIFDGVPSLPPPEEICKDYDPARAAAVQNAAAGEKKGEKEKEEGSQHPPYIEKKCSSCHSTEKDKDGGLIQPKEKLCSLCHPNFLTGDFSHGPAAVGDCLGCHMPHTSSNKYLLALSGDKVCLKCHQEARLTSSMHNRLNGKGITCTECHNPHSSNARYFLR